MASLCLKRKKQPGQPYGQGGVFGLSSPEPAPRDGRKRRKDKLTHVKHTRTPYFDGHLWRKYGQKTIKNAPCPRLYFRCSYREDRNCMASKLVQQVSDGDLPLYEVTYMYEHTCNAAPVPTPDVVVPDEPPAAPSGGLVLSFGSSSSGGGHRNARMQQQLLLQEERRQQHQPPTSPLLTMSLDNSNNIQQHTFPSRLPPPTTSSSPLFPIIESSTTPPWTDDDDNILTWDWDWDWDSFPCDSDDHLQFGDHVQFPGSSFSWKTEGSSPAHLNMGIEAEGRGCNFLVGNN